MHLILKRPLHIILLGHILWRSSQVRVKDMANRSVYNTTFLLEVIQFVFPIAQ